MRSIARQAGEFRQCIKREVHLTGGATVFIALHLVTKILAQVLGLDEPALLSEIQARAEQIRERAGIRLPPWFAEAQR